MENLWWCTIKLTLQNVEKDSVRSVFPKDYGEWQNWINNGKATNIDKEKALECLGALRNHHETELTEQELSPVANIVKGFKT